MLDGLIFDSRRDIFSDVIGGKKELTELQNICRLQKDFANLFCGRINFSFKTEKKSRIAFS